MKKRGPVPDYGLEIGDDEDIPDYGLEDLFGEEVQPQNNKQLVPKPPPYEDVLEELASGEKKMYIDPEYMYKPKDLPPEYEEGPDYAIFEEDQINEVLDKLDLPNYDDVEGVIQQKEMNEKKRKAYLETVIKKAKHQQNRLNGYRAQITTNLKKGLISEAEAQMRRKVIQETGKVLTDYKKYNNQKLKNIKGSGLKKKRGGAQVMFFNNPTEMMQKLELVIGSMAAGNNSIKLRNTGVALLDILFRNSIINRSQYNKIYKNYFSLN